MSRCFPFPPPGYEKKARIDDTDLLKKEKNKEKKNKKYKKEKEKKEGKEKRDKDRSKEKHREKKDRKEKHKDKDKDRNKEKNQASDEKKVEAQPGFYNGEKISSNSLQNNERRDSNSIHIQELARRIRDEDRASGSQMVQKVAATDQRRGEVRGMVVERSIGNQTEEKNKVKNRNEDQRKINGQRNHIEPRGLGTAFGQDISGMDRESVERIVKLVDKKDAEKQMDGKEKSKHKDSDSKSDKHKGKDRDKKRKSKDRDRDKEEKKEEKVKEIIETSKQKTKLKENVTKVIEANKDPLDFRNIKSSETLKLNNTSPAAASPAAEGNLGKRKELERNGYLFDNGNRPGKFQRPLSSSNLAVENGKKSEQCQTVIQLSSEKQGISGHHKADGKEQKINGLIATKQPPNICSTKPSSTGIQAKEKGEISSKSQANENGGTSSKPHANENGVASSKPHPDTKYLSQILSIPEMEEWSDASDQEWLFSSNSLQRKKPRISSPGVDGIPQVWAEALRLDSADISALPYVIPY
ncbi:hypothetical protein JCGZ_15155 [Jatropha curcas]|uniref:Uncharacterized protein n=1 Tax=Jatropha curcas TaxID=180498 RepID=A0A067LKR9_JATCU|nr:hypothetical protein JCGZ_15155 [Jatropha curcas]